MSRGAGLSLKNEVRRDRAAAGATAKADARPRMVSTAPDSPRSLPPASPVEPVPCSRAHPASRVPRATLRGASHAKRGDATGRECCRTPTAWHVDFSTTFRRRRYA